MTNDNCSSDVFSYSAVLNAGCRSEDSNSFNFQSLESFTPQDIYDELTRFIVGQDEAKRSVAIALCNRMRRLKVPLPMRDEIIPKNMIMIGPTGVGKTEIARRLAKMVDAPFIKVEATKFTEVGYVGRDVDSIIRDLVEVAIEMTKKRARSKVKILATEAVYRRIVDALIAADSVSSTTVEEFKKKVQSGELDDVEIDIKMREIKNSSPMLDIPGMSGQVGVVGLSDMFGNMLSNNQNMVKKRLTISDAKKFLLDEEIENLIDMDVIKKDAIDSVENNGVVFLDEIDKIAINYSHGKVNADGVQRDLLPLLEGTTVFTKHGSVNTDHILFIASGAFHISKPSDLLPELQGRLPVRVELNPLDLESMVRILRDTESSILKQYCSLLEAENVKLSFSHEAIYEIAKIAIDVNQEVEDIGARRLHTIMEKLLELVSFDAHKYRESGFLVDVNYVQERLSELLKKTDLLRFII